MERQDTSWEKAFTVHLPDKVLVSIHMKNSYTDAIKMQNPYLQTTQKPKKERVTHEFNRCVKICQHH